MKRKSSQTEVIDTVHLHNKVFKHHDQVDDSNKTKDELIEEIRKLKTLNDQFRKALDAVSTSVCITEDDGTVIFMNKRCKELLTPVDQTNQNESEIQKDAPICNGQYHENNSENHEKEIHSHHGRADFSPMSISELTNQTPPQPISRQPSNNNIHESESKSQIGDNFFVALGSNSNANELCCIPKPLKATISRIDPETKKEHQYALVCEAHDTSEGEEYLINTVTEANAQQKMVCEIYRDIVEHFSAGISVWCLEETTNEPTFRLVGMNKQAREKLNSPQIEVGLTLVEILRDFHAQQITSTFTSVLNTNKEISVDQFTLDGKATFSVKITPFKYKCVGVMIGSPKAHKSRDREKNKEKEKEDLLPQPHYPPMNYSIHSEEIFKQAFEYNPMMMGIFKRVDIGNRIDYQILVSNSAGRSARKQSFSLPSGKLYLSEAFPIFQDQKFMQQLVSSAIGKPMVVAINDWTNDNYSGGIYFGKFTRLPNDALLSVFMPLTAGSLRQYTAVFNYCCQKEYVKEDLKDVHVFNSALENIAKVAPPLPATAQVPFSSQHSSSIPIQAYPILPPLSPPNHFHHESHDVDFMHPNFATNSFSPQPINDRRTPPPISRSPGPASASLVSPTQQPTIPPMNTSSSSGATYQQHQLLLQVLREQQVRQQLLLQQIQLQAEKQQMERDKLEQDKAAFEKELESHRKSLPFLINSINAQGQPDIGLEAFKVAFHDAPIGMSLVSTHGSILACNHKVATMLGYTVDDIVNNTFVPITHPEDVESSVEIFKQMLSGKANGAQMLKRYVHKAGHAVWCLLSTTLARDGSGNPLVFISSLQLLDSLKTILSGAEVKRDEELYRQIFNKSNVGMSLLGKDGCVQNVNNTFLDRMHWHSSDVIGKPYFNFFIKEDQENIRNLIQTMAEGRLLRHQTLARIEEASGDAFWCLLNLYCLIDANGVVTHVLAKFQDVEPLQKLFSQHTFPKPKGRRQMIQQ